MSAQPLDVRMARLEGVYEQLERRLGDLIATIDGRFGNMDGRFAQMDSRFEQMNSRFAQVDSRFGQVESRLDSLSQKVDGLQWRFTSLIVVTWITTILAILLHR